MSAAMPDPAAKGAERNFFSAMAAGIVVVALAGFARTYFLRPFLPPPPEAFPPLTPLVHLHGVLFTAWVVLFLLQVRLVAGKRLALHRKLGAGAAVLAAFMVGVGALTAIRGAARGMAPFGVDPQRFMLLPLVSMLLFAVYVAAGVAVRRNAQAHKRWMLLATIAMLPPAIARWVLLLGLGPPVIFAVATLLLVPLVIWDLRTLKRLHPVTLWAGLFLVLSGPLRIAVSRTDGWLAVANWLVELTT